MCGNGARCICRYAYENGLSGERITVETTAGIVTGLRIDQRHYRVRLNNPTVLRLEGEMTVTTEDLNQTFPCHYVELGDPGVPHAAIPCKNLKEADEDELRHIARAIRWHHDFPKGANVNFYEITGPDTLYERTFERGVEDFTYACGTGTGSVVAALTLMKKVSGRNVRVDMKGGTLVIDVEMLGGEIISLYLTGPTTIVARGEVLDEDYFTGSADAPA